MSNGRPILVTTDGNVFGMAGFGADSAKSPPNRAARHVVADAELAAR